jgi:hypothetical protein
MKKYVKANRGKNPDVDPEKVVPCGSPDCSREVRAGDAHLHGWVWLVLTPEGAPKPSRAWACPDHAEELDTAFEIVEKPS